MDAEEQKAYGARLLKTARTLTIVAGVLGPLSMFIGGILMSTAGIVCAILALLKIQQYGILTDAPSSGLWTARIPVITVLVIDAAAFILNVIVLAIVMPIMADLIQSGDYSVLFAPETGMQATETGGANTWG